MWNLARRQLRQGLSVICDSPLTFPGLYETARALAAESHAALAVIECVCGDDDLLQVRIEGRQCLGLPSHHQTDWGRYCAYRDKVAAHTHYPIDDAHIVLETSRPLEQIVNEAEAWLQGSIDEPSIRVRLGRGTERHDVVCGEMSSWGRVYLIILAAQIKPEMPSALEHRILNPPMHVRIAIIAIDLVRECQSCAKKL